MKLQQQKREYYAQNKISLRKIISFSVINCKAYKLHTNPRIYQEASGLLLFDITFETRLFSQKT